MVPQLKLDELQSYGELFAPSGPPQAVRGEQRQSDRKVIEVGGVLTIDGTAIDIKTVDISSGGLCIRSAKQLAVGKECQLSFELPVASVVRPIASRVHVIYAFYTTEHDFKVGLEFLHLAAADADHLKQFAGT